MRSNVRRPRVDRIQVSTAQGTDGIVRRIEVRAREGNTNWVIFALSNNSDDQLDRLIVAPHYRMVSSGLMWPDLGLSRIVAITPSIGDRPDRQESAIADVFRVTLDPGAVVTFVMEMRTERAAAALSVGTRRLQGQDQLLHALSGHRHRHRGTSRAGADHPVRRQGQRDVSGRRRARLGGAGLYRRRLRILGQGLRHVGGRRTCVARIGRSHPGRDAAGVCVRLSQPQPLARALFAHHLRLADLLRIAGGAGAVRSAGCVRHRAALARGHCRLRLRADRLSLHARLRSRGAA